MPKKKFNKKEGFRFTLIHRSQQDPLYYDDEHGSKLILHPADRKTAKAMESGALDEHERTANYVTSESAVKAKSQLAEKRQKALGTIREYREVDEYGLPLDGYDYSKHLSTIGGGAFMSAGGSLLANPLPVQEKEPVEDDDIMNLLSVSAVASATEHPRLLEAITLDPKNMDADMKRQLGLLDDNVDEDEEDQDEEDDGASAATGEWGDLQDDFMAKVIEGGVAPAEDDESQAKFVTGDGAVFDFDAHMARLMQEAEEEDEEEDDDMDEEDVLRHMATQGSSLHDRPKRDVDDHFEAVLAAEYENDGDEDEDEEDGLDDEADGHNEEEYYDQEVGEEEEEEEIDLELGEDEDVEDVLAMLKRAELSKSTRKRDDLESQTTSSRRSKRPPPKLLSQDDPIVQQALSDFLKQKEKDASLGEVAEPPSAQEILRFVPDKYEKTNQSSVVDDRAGLTQAHVEEEEAAEEEDDDQVPTYEEFMKMWGTYSVTVKPQFDCQTIVSTRSTTDNLPTQIEIGRSKREKSKRKTSDATNDHVAKGEKDRLSQNGRPSQGEGDDEEEDDETVEDLVLDVARMTVDRMHERSRTETPEERKERKAQVKELKRERRAQKKQTKETFKKEKAQMIRAITAEGAPKPGISEFKLG